MSREEVQEAGSPFNLAPLGGRRNGSNTARTDAGCETFFYSLPSLPQGVQSRVCTRIRGKSISNSMHSRGRPLSRLTSCPSTRGECRIWNPSVGKVGDSNGGWMRIGILFGRSIFRGMKEGCARFTVIRARWRIFDGMELGFERVWRRRGYIFTWKSLVLGLSPPWISIFSIFIFRIHLLLSGSAISLRYFLHYKWKYNWKQYVIMILKIFIPYIHLSEIQR